MSYLTARSVARRLLLSLAIMLLSLSVWAALPTAKLRQTIKKAKAGDEKAREMLENEARYYETLESSSKSIPGLMSEEDKENLRLIRAALGQSSPSDATTSTARESAPAPSASAPDPEQLRLMVHKLFIAEVFPDREGESKRQADAAAALIRVGAPAVPLLIEVVDGPDLDLVIEADPEAIGGERRWTCHSLRCHLGVREIAIKVLGLLGPVAKDAIPALVKKLDDDQFHTVAAQALDRMGNEAKLLVAKSRRERQERERKMLHQRVKDADRLLEAILGCASAEGAMQAQGLIAQDQVARTLSRPSQKTLDQYEVSSAGAASKCGDFSTLYSTYLDDYDNKGYAYLWNRCDRKFNPRLCMKMRRWLKTHR